VICGLLVPGYNREKNVACWSGRTRRLQ